MSDLAIPAPVGLALFQDDAPIDAGQHKMPWIKYFSPKSKEGVSGKCKAAGVRVESWYFEDAHGVTAISPVKLHLLSLHRFNAKIDQKGGVVATRGKDYRCPNTPKKFKQGVLGLCLVQTPGGLQVACLQAVSGLCAIFNGYEGIRSDWARPAAMAKKGPKFEDAAEAAVAVGRFTLTIGGYGKEVENDDGETFEANIGTRVIEASTPAEVEAFNAYYTNGQEVLADSAAYFSRLVDRLNKLDDTVYGPDGKKLNA